MFDWKKKLGLLAIPGAGLAAVAMMGSAGVVSAATATPTPTPPAATAPAEPAEAAETPGAPEPAEAAEPAGTPDLAGGHADAAGTTVDHQFDGQE